MKRIILILFVAVSMTTVVSAQQKAQLYAIHEDQVKPSMNGKYWECMRKVKANSTQHKLNARWISLAFDDNSFIHMVPIENFAQLDKKMFADLEAKMGREAHAAMWADFDQCLETSTDYFVTSMPELSYSTPAEDDSYRDVMFWQVIPGQEKVAEDILREWVKVYEAKKVPSGFLTFKVLFGAEPGYAIATWGKNEVDCATNFQKTKELLGEEGKAVWRKTMAISKKYHYKRGGVLKDASYAFVAQASN